MGHKPYGIYEKYLKRPLDCFLALCALVILSPVIGIAAFFVSINLGRPVLFTQERLGIDEKIFKLYKLRSMSNARDREGKLLCDDERMTKFGKILRSTSIDELPELLNIVKGDMSVIGPRPLLAEYKPFYTKREHRRHDVRPGLSGLAQMNGRNANSWDTMFRLDLEYVDKITFLGDVKIIWGTVWKVFKRADIYAGAEKCEGRLDVERLKGKKGKQADE